MSQNQGGYREFTAEEKAEFQRAITISRTEHCDITDRLVTLASNGAILAADEDTAEELQALLGRAYQLTHQKAPRGVRPPMDATEAPKLAIKKGRVAKR